MRNLFKFDKEKMSLISLDFFFKNKTFYKILFHIFHVFEIELFFYLYH